MEGEIKVSILPLGITAVDITRPYLKKASA